MCNCVVHIACGPIEPLKINKNDIVFHWNSKNCPSTEYSIQAWYEEHFLSLRQELVELVYNLGIASVQGKLLYDHFAAGDRLSMWWCSMLFEKHPMLMPELLEILKLRSLEQMLEHFAPQCDSVILHGGSQALTFSLSQFCSKKNIKFSSNSGWLAQKFLPYLQKVKECISFIFYIVRAQLRFIHWLVTVYLFTSLAKEDPPSGPCVTMVSYFPHGQMFGFEAGHYSSPYWGALSEVIQSAQKKISWLFIRINSPTMSFKQVVSKLKLAKAIGMCGASFHFAEEFLSLSAMASAYIRYVKLCYIGQKTRCAVSQLSMLGHMNIWIYLQPYYAESFQGWRCLERCLQRRAMLGYVAWVGKQEFTLFPMENCPWERMLTEALRFNGNGQVYGAQHSVLRPADFRYFDSPKLFELDIAKNFLPHKILVNGKRAYELMLTAHVPETLLLGVEALRYLHLLKYFQQETVTNSRRKLIVITSFFQNSMQEHLALLAKWLEQKPQGKWYISIKPHPYCSVDEAVKKHSLNSYNIEITSKNIDNLLLEAKEQGGVFWLAHDTSVIVEALYAKVPLMVQNSGSAMNICPVQGIDGLQYVYTFSDVQNALEERQVLHIDSQFFYLDLHLTKWRNFLAI